MITKDSWSYMTGIVRDHGIGLGLVAIGSAGIGLLSAGVESLQMLEAALVGQDTTQQVQPALP